eukprot:TRINITY_DN38750_c0_g1_i1.p1 TRINITY_DN38750_c0_g1~~TRINITY_DN38750_c0_g1_i1.p1  ORF type:complete len:320 (-),score=49.38 TRINITY_DN38750_c0_g1_i1:70-990(-)
MDDIDYQSVDGNMEGTSDVASISSMNRIYTVIAPGYGWDNAFAILLTVMCLCIAWRYFMMSDGAPTQRESFGIGARAWAGRWKSALPRGKVYFKPTEVYQEVLPEHVLPNGLELRMDFETGKNFARLQSGTIDEASARGHSYSDEPTVVEHLCDAATWGRPDRVRQLLGTCYYRLEALTVPLCEASSRGHLDVCEVLLRRRADPLGRDPNCQGLTPLHRAVGEGHESIAAALLDRCLAAGREDALTVVDNLGRTCLDVAREQDLGPAARRIATAFSKRVEATKTSPSTAFRDGRDANEVDAKEEAS